MFLPVCTDRAGSGHVDLLKRTRVVLPMRVKRPDHQAIRRRRPDALQLLGGRLGLHLGPADRQDHQPGDPGGPGRPGAVLTISNKRDMVGATRGPPLSSWAGCGVYDPQGKVDEPGRLVVEPADLRQRRGQGLHACQALRQRPSLPVRPSCSARTSTSRLWLPPLLGGSRVHAGRSRALAPRAAQKSHAGRAVRLLRCR